jgi:DNA polymerase-4
MTQEASVIHLNVVNYPASVEILRDPALRDRAFAVAEPRLARARILDVSRRALREGIEPGMTVDEAERRVRDLRIVPPSPGSYDSVNRAIETLCAHFAPLLENSGGGHFFLDLKGTRRLFGDYVDQAARIRNEVASRIGIDAATALASNKLVAKVGTRSLRPDGFVAIREGDEAAFLCRQEIALLPGVGTRIGRILRVAGIREIGELAGLGDGESRGLLGHLGPALRDAARGVDPTSVQDGRLAGRHIENHILFDTDVIDEASILAALVTLVETCGLELRRARLAAFRVETSLTYADGVTGRGMERSARPLALDAELLGAARRALARAATRRVRVSELALGLAGLEPCGLQLDLFDPGRDDGPAMAVCDEEAFGPAGLLGRLERQARLQAAVDATRERFGRTAVTRGSAIAGGGPKAAVTLR